MDEQSIRNGALLKSGTLSPNPWDLTLSGQNGWLYNVGTRTEGQGSAGMRPERRFERRNGNGRLRCRGRPKHQIPTRRRLTYCGPNLVLTKGSTLHDATANSNR